MVLAIRRNGAEPKILLHHEIPRPEGRSASNLLTELLAALSPDFRKAPLSVALSSAEFACADAWQPPEPLARSGLMSVAAPLCEAKCAGETLEELSLDVVPAGRGLEAVALPNDVLRDLRRAAESSGMALGLVTSLPSVLAHAFPREEFVRLQFAGDQIEVRKDDGRISWRSFPVDLAERAAPSAPLKWGTAEISPDEAPACAAAVVDPDIVPNALRGAPDAPRSFLAKFRGPVLRLAGAAAAMLLALGLWLDVKARAAERDLSALAEIERGFWKDLLPGQSPRDGELLRTIRDRVREAGDLQGQRDWPSALSFWAEIGRHMPDAEALGMTLESLDLSPEGGRLTATVTAHAGDDLRNAALVEAKLNASPRMTARGDFERRDKEVQLRLRMDFRGNPGGAR
jgi:hypothetical protein